MNKPLILVVEDDPAVARLISTTLETRNYQYHRVQNGAYRATQEMLSLSVFHSKVR